MIVIDRTSFRALLAGSVDSSIQRAIDQSDVPMIYLAQQSFDEINLAHFVAANQDELTALLERLERVDVTLVPAIKVRRAAAKAVFDQHGHESDDALTLGDCAAYALAKALRADLVSERLSAYEVVGLEWMTEEFQRAEREERFARLVRRGGRRSGAVY